MCSSLGRTRKRAVPPDVLLIALCLCLGAEFTAYSQTADPEKTATAFIAHQRILHFSGKPGSSPVVREQTYARRSDGSYVSMFENTSPTGETGWGGEIFDVRRGRSISLFESVNLASTFYHSAADMRKQFAAQQNCSSVGLASGAAKPAAEETDHLLGRKVTRVRESSRIGPQIDMWVAPELDCFPLRKSEFSPRGSHNEIIVTKIEEVEPPDSMFEMPPEYVEASPLQIEAAFAAKYPGQLPLFGSEKMAQTVEERYMKHRKPQ